MATAPRRTAYVFKAIERIQSINLARFEWCCADGGVTLDELEREIDDDGDLRAVECEEREVSSFAGHLLAPDGFLLSIRDNQRPPEVTGFDDWLAPHLYAGILMCHPC